MPVKILVSVLAAALVIAGVVMFMATRHSGIRYVPIGDSYTFGEGAASGESWVPLLVNDLNAHGVQISLAANPAQTGWTTQQAVDSELPIYESSSPGFSTLLIGVNDWWHNVDAKSFRANLVILLDRMQAKLPQKDHLLVLTIPNFGVTPGGRMYGNGRDIAAGISEFNQIINEEAQKRQLTVVDLFTLSEDMGKDRSLRASDNLHPSAKEYALWEKQIYPAAYALLSKKSR